MRLTREQEHEVRSFEDAVADPLSRWYVTGDGLLADPEPPPPAIAWSLDEGGALLRAGRRYLIVGEAGIGKSLLAQGACIEAALAGRPAVFLDWEDSLRTFLVRSRALRVGFGERALDAYATRHLFYAQMVGEVLDRNRPLPEECSIVVIDSLSRAMGAHGLDENSAPDFHAFVRDVIDRLREQAPDAALLLLDHPGHADPRRGRGTSAKRPVVDVELTLERAGRDRLRLVVRKDRHADIAAPANATVAEVAMLGGAGGTVTIRYQEPTASFTPDGTYRRTGYMERVSRYLAERTEPVSGRQVREDVEGKAEWIGEALRVLAQERYAAAENGPRGATIYRHLRLFTEDGDPIDGSERHAIEGTGQGTTGSREQGARA